MLLKNILKNWIKKPFRAIGTDIIRRKNNPELTLLGLYRRPFSTIIDVGANKGQFVQKIFSFFPNADIYCFEPLNEPFIKLTEWANTQRCNIRAFNLAIGDEDKDVEIYLHKAHTPSSSLLTTTTLNESHFPIIKEQKKITVQQKTLDHAFEDENINISDLPRDILIKLDVQGYEEHVIAGGQRVFSQASACILEINLDALYKGQAEFKVIVDMMTNLGYRYAGNLTQHYAEDGHCIFLDAVFLRSDGISKLDSGKVK
tara:strand:+ start:1621 stop:2394 length:774 start_codon:yes stop_codon:yes gene_type:complete